MSHRKRKHSSSTQQQPRPHRDRRDSGRPALRQSSSSRETDTSCLFIQAYEADLVHGPRARLAAQSLEVASTSTEERDGQIGDGLIRWGGDGGSGAHPGSSSSTTYGDYGYGIQDVSDEGDESWKTADQYPSGDEPVWMDRYDARLLLDRLPQARDDSASEAGLASPGSIGWSDLPSDAEDTFFFEPDEAEEYHREKRRRLIDKNRMERLQALREEGRDREQEEDGGGDVWGGSDEEPDDVQKTFMRKAATQLLSSPNPAVLEMRILANHGADARFAFLRGRWACSWRSIKMEVGAELDKIRAAAVMETASSGLKGLDGYGDSDEEATEDEGEAREIEPDVPEVVVVAKGDVTEEAIKAARRERAKEWARKRRAP